MLSVEQVATRLGVLPIDVFFRAKQYWRPTANAISDYHGYKLTGVIPPYVLALLDCEERKLGSR